MPIVFASNFYQVYNSENAFKLVQIIRGYRLCAQGQSLTKINLTH